MGALVFPIRPGSKEPLTEHGVKDASNYLPQLKSWSLTWPDAGIALAARDIQPGDLCFLEFDQRPTLNSWAKELGQSMIETRIHLSGGKRLPHFIFQQTEKSIQLGNCDGKGPYCEDPNCPEGRTKGGLHKHEWFSFRAFNRYVLAPPSIHPDTGNPYTVFVDIPPVPIPDWVVDAIAARGVSEKQAGKEMGARPASEKFDFDDLIEWMGVRVAEINGAYHGLDICPAAGRRHEGQNDRSAAFYWDEGSLGFKCHAAECRSNTERIERNDGTREGGIACLMRLLQAENGRYEGEIWPERENEFEAEPVVDEFEDDLVKALSFSGKQEEPKQDVMQETQAAEPSSPVQEPKVEDWTAMMFAAIFHDPKTVYPDFRIWRNRIEWIVNKKALPKNELPLIALLLEYENAKKRLPSRDELVLYKPELMGKLDIPALEGNYAFDYCVDIVLARAERLDELRTAEKYLQGVKGGKKRDDLRTKVRRSWANSITVDTAKVEGSIQDRADEIYERFQRYTEGEETRHRFDTPFAVINRIIDTDAERCFAVIAPSSNFKTSVLLSVTHDLAEQGKAVLFIAGEQEPENIEDRLTLIHGYRQQYAGKLPTYKQIRDKKATKEDLANLRDLCDDWKNLRSIPGPIVVKNITDFNNDFDKIVGWMDETDRKYQWGALIVDPFEELVANANPEKLFFEGNKVCQKFLSLKTNYQNGRGLICATSFQMKKAIGKKIKDIYNDGDTMDDIKAFDYEAALDRNDIETFSGASKKFDMLWGIANTSDQGTKGIITCARTRYGRPFPATYFKVEERSHYCHQSGGSNEVVTPPQANPPRKTDLRKLLREEKRNAKLVNTDEFIEGVL
jgi:hypothetical protein